MPPSQAAIEKAHKPTILSILAPMASMGLVCRPAELGAMEREVVRKFNIDARKAAFTVGASERRLGDFGRKSEFAGFESRSELAGKDRSAWVNKATPAVCSSTTTIADRPESKTDSSFAARYVDAQQVHAVADADDGKDKLVHKLPKEILPVKGMYTSKLAVRFQNVLVCLNLMVRKSSDMPPERLVLAEHQLQQLAFAFEISDYSRRRRLGPLQARLRSPIYDKFIIVNMFPKGTANITNITHPDEITYAVRVVINALRTTGAALLASATPYNPLVPQAEQHAKRLLTVTAQDVDVRNIRAQCYLPGWINTYSMQIACADKLEPHIHDAPPTIRIKRDLFPLWYGKNICVRLTSQGLITVMGARSFTAVEECVRFSYDLAYKFICMPSHRVCKRFYETLGLGSFIDHIDRGTSLLPVPEKKSCAIGSKSVDELPEKDESSSKPKPKPKRRRRAVSKKVANNIKTKTIRVKKVPPLAIRRRAVTHVSRNFVPTAEAVSHLAAFYHVRKEIVEKNSLKRIAGKRSSRSATKQTKEQHSTVRFVSAEPNNYSPLPTLKIVLRLPSAKSSVINNDASYSSKAVVNADSTVKSAISQPSERLAARRATERIQKQSVDNNREYDDDSAVIYRTSKIYFDSDNAVVGGEPDSDANFTETELSGGEDDSFNVASPVIITSNRVRVEQQQSVLKRVYQQVNSGFNVRDSVTKGFETFFPNDMLNLSGELEFVAAQFQPAV